MELRRRRQGAAIRWYLVRDLRGRGSFSCDDVGLARDGVVQDALWSAAMALTGGQERQSGGGHPRMGRKICTPWNAHPQ